MPKAKPKPKPYHCSICRELHWPSDPGTVKGPKGPNGRNQMAGSFCSQACRDAWDAVEVVRSAANIAARRNPEEQARCYRFADVLLRAIRAGRAPKPAAIIAAVECFVESLPSETPAPPSADHERDGEPLLAA